MLQNPFEYIWHISADSFSQSSRESWIIHKESIHKYLSPRLRVTLIASLNVFGSSSKSIDCIIENKFSIVNTTGIDFISPQQWLKVTYCAREVIDAPKESRSAKFELIPTSTRRVGRKVGAKTRQERCCEWQRWSHNLAIDKFWLEVEVAAAVPFLDKDPITT